MACLEVAVVQVLLCSGKQLVHCEEVSACNGSHKPREEPVQGIVGVAHQQERETHNPQVGVLKDTEQPHSEPETHLVSGILVSVVRPNVELIRQVPLLHCHVREVGQDGRALHL